MTIVDDTANVTLNSNANGTFQCSVDGRDPETCKESRDTLLAGFGVDPGILAINNNTKIWPLLYCMYYYELLLLVRAINLTRCFTSVHYSNRGTWLRTFEEQK